MAECSRNVASKPLLSIFVSFLLQERELRTSQLVVDSLDDDFGGLVKLLLNDLLLLLITEHLPQILIVILLMHALLSIRPHRNVIRVAKEPILLDGRLNYRLSDYLLPLLS